LSKLNLLFEVPEVRMVFWFVGWCNESNCRDCKWFQQITVKVWIF